MESNVYNVRAQNFIFFLLFACSCTGQWQNDSCILFLYCLDLAMKCSKQMNHRPCLIWSKWPLKKKIGVYSRQSQLISIVFHVQRQALGTGEPRFLNALSGAKKILNLKFWFWCYHEPNVFLFFHRLYTLLGYICAYFYKIEVSCAGDICGNTEYLKIAFTCHLALLPRMTF